MINDEKNTLSKKIVERVKKNWWIYLIIAVACYLIGTAVPSSNTQGNVAGELEQMRAEQRARSFRESMREQEKERQRRFERTWDQMHPPRSNYNSQY